jgi:hypothetical protein
MTYEDFFANAIARSHDERRHRVIAILAQYHNIRGGRDVR